MGTGFVMDSSKTSFAEVPVLLTHRVSAGDKPALSQLLQGLRQPAQALSHNREGKGQNQTLGKRAGGGGGEKRKRTTNLPSILSNVTCEANKFYLCCHLIRMRERNLKFGGKVQVMFLLATCKAKGIFRK